jgi:hypothetical protein
MVVPGDQGRWAALFPDTFIPKIIQLVLDSWEYFEYQGQLKEVPITQRFCACLRNQKNRSKTPLSIFSESSELNAKGDMIGRIDLRFSYGCREEVYFSLECKRLRVRFPSRFDTLAGKYVTEGMNRYFNGQYAVGLDKGGMLGYVMDSDVGAAIQDVKGAIEKRRSDLYIEENDSFRKCSCVDSDQVKETHHHKDPRKPFIVYHVFVPWRGKRQTKGG